MLVLLCSSGALAAWHVLLLLGASRFSLWVWCATVFPGKKRKQVDHESLKAQYRRLRSKYYEEYGAQPELAAHSGAGGEDGEEDGDAARPAPAKKAKKSPAELAKEKQEAVQAAKAAVCVCVFASRTICGGLSAIPISDCLAPAEGGRCRTAQEDAQAALRSDCKGPAADEQPRRVAAGQGAEAVRHEARCEIGPRLPFCACVL